MRDRRLAFTACDMALRTMLCPLVLACLVTLASLASASARKPPGPGPGKMRYYVNLQRELTSCENFNNSVVDVTQVTVEKRGKSGLALVGNLTLEEDLSDIEYQLDLFVDKNTNWEYLTTYDGKDLCQRLKDEDAAWTPFVKEVGIVGCPIIAGTYMFQKSALDISMFPFPSQGVAGIYRGQAYLLRKGQKISCHSADIAIST